MVNELNPQERISRAIDLAVEAFSKATGFTPYEQRKLAYYAVATNFIADFNVFPQLVVSGVPGTGKSVTLSLLRLLCYKVVPITGETTSPAAWKAAMAESENGTLIVEEAEGVAQSSLESVLITRYSRDSAQSSKMEYDGSHWVFSQRGTFGSTIFHRRNLFADPALLRRLIVIRTKRRPGTYETVNDHTYPALFQLYNRLLAERPTLPPVNNNWNIEPAILDAFRPLVALGQYIQDDDFVEQLVSEMKAASQNLIEEEGYLEVPILLRALISLASQKLKDKVPEKPINVEVSRIDPTTREEFGPSNPILKLSPNQRNRIITGTIGFPIRSSHGRNRVYFTIRQLIEACEANGVADDSLDGWKVALGMMPALTDESSEPEPEDLNRAWETERE